MSRHGISVLVPTYRRPNELRRCLDGLAQQSLPPAEVIVVQREGDAETAAVLASWMHRVSTIEVSEPGVIAALQAGLERTSASIVAFTDDDACPRRDWLERIAAHFETEADLGAVGGRDVVHTGETILDGTAREIGRVRWWGRTIGNHHLAAPDQEVHFLKGANMAYRRIALPRFDDALQGTGAQLHNDMDVSLGVWRAGWRILYDPSIVVDHYPAPRHDGHVRGSSAAAAALEQAHNETYVLLKWLPWWQKAAALLYAIAVGSRAAPGCAVAVERLIREQDRRRVLSRFAAALQGRALAVTTYARMLAAR